MMEGSVVEGKEGREYEDSTYKSDPSGRACRGTKISSKKGRRTERK